MAGRMASFIDITERKLAEEENRRLSSELLKSQELERQRLARDLHDSIAQTINAAKINFIAYQRDPGLFADRVTIQLHDIDEKILILVRDNGIGFDTDTVREGHKGYGITNIRHRVKDLGGRFSMESSEKLGTEIYFELKHEEED
jgi:signal transduction histidine kinase